MLKDNTERTFSGWLKASKKLEPGNGPPEHFATNKQMVYLTHGAQGRLSETQISMTKSNFEVISLNGNQDRMLQDLATNKECVEFPRKGHMVAYSDDEEVMTEIVNLKKARVFTVTYRELLLMTGPSCVNDRQIACTII